MKSDHGAKPGPGARALVLSGRGRYADPWHDHAATSWEVARILAEAVEVVEEVEVRGTFADALDDVDRFDLLVVNSGRGTPDPAYDGDDAAWTAHHERLDDYARAGGAVLGLHQSANTFADTPAWAEVLGARWVPGRSSHPPIGESSFDQVGTHPVTTGLGPVRAWDERYCDVEVASGATVLLTHEEDGVVHPAVWVRDDGRRRSAYDALGHGVASYRSPARRELLVREVTWLLEGPR